MRLYKMFGVWMFEKQTEEEKLSLKEITERIDLHYKEDKKSLQWCNSNCKSCKQSLLFSCMLYNGASNVEPLISIYRIFGLIYPL